MTERQSDAVDVVEILRDRLGVTYHASIDGGRGEIVGVIADELNVGRDEAEEILRMQMEAGRIRYVVGSEVDPVGNPEVQDDRARRGDEGVTDRSDNLRVNAIPGQGGPDAATSGLTAGAAAPLVAGGTTSPAAAPLAAGVDIGGSAEDLQRGGYWEFAGDRAGVVPSSTRKGQVEPKGT